MEILKAMALLANFVLVPATAYGAQLALGALGVTLIFGIFVSTLLTLVVIPVLYYAFAYKTQQ